jgi:diadenosine tetraphosphate (Ap4A) HIT family hydrolase
MSLAVERCMACDVLEGRREAPGGTILREGRWVLDHSLSPCLLRGWLILKPERHVEHVAELTAEESASLGQLIQKASRALMTAVGAERVYVVSMGEVVRHVHFYLIPRYAHMPQHGLEVLSEMFSEGRPWGCSDEEANAAARAVRRELAGANAKRTGGRARFSAARALPYDP